MHIVQMRTSFHYVVSFRRTNTCKHMHAPHRVGQNRINTPYMTVYLMKSLQTYIDYNDYCQPCAHTLTKTHTYMHARTCTRMHIHILRTNICTYTHARTHIHAQTHTRTRMHTQYAQAIVEVLRDQVSHLMACTNTHTYTHAHTLRTGHCGSAA